MRTFKILTSHDPNKGGHWYLINSKTLNDACTFLKEKYPSAAPVIFAYDVEYKAIAEAFKPEKVMI